MVIFETRDVHKLHLHTHVRIHTLTHTYIYILNDILINTSVTIMMLLTLNSSGTLNLGVLIFAQ